jgi:hypothetical protein
MHLRVGSHGPDLRVRVRMKVLAPIHPDTALRRGVQEDGVGARQNKGMLMPTAGELMEGIKWHRC